VGAEGANRDLLSCIEDAVKFGANGTVAQDFQPLVSSSIDPKWAPYSYTAVIWDIVPDSSRYADSKVVLYSDTERTEEEQNLVCTHLCENDCPFKADPSSLGFLQKSIGGASDLGSII
jgi:hypothetical protein